MGYLSVGAVYGLSMKETETLDESRTVVNETLMPNDTNNLGRALGGSVLHWRTSAPR